MSAGEEQIAMRKYHYVLLALTVFVLTAAFVVAPQSSATGDSQGAPADDMYFLSSYRNAALLPYENFPPH